MPTNNIGNSNILTSMKAPLDAKLTPVKSYEDLKNIRHTYVGMRVVVLNTEFENCLPFEYEAVNVKPIETSAGMIYKTDWKLLSPVIIGSYAQLIDETLFPIETIEEGLEATLIGIPSVGKLRKYVCIKKPNCDLGEVRVTWEEKAYFSNEDIEELVLKTNFSLTLIDQITNVIGNEGVSIDISAGGLIENISGNSKDIKKISETIEIINYDISKVNKKHDEDVNKINDNILTTKDNILEIVEINKKECDKNYKNNSNRLDAIEEKLLLDGAVLDTSMSPTQKVRDEKTNITVSCSTNLDVKQSLEIIQGGNVVASTTGMSLSYTFKDITGSLSVTFNLKYGDRVIRTDSITCSAYYYVYCGFAKEYTDLTNHLSLRSYATGTYTATSTVDDVYYFILVPTGISVPTNFSMGGAPYVMNNLGTKTFKGISYTVLKSGGLYGIGGNVNILVS